MVPSRIIHGQFTKHALEWKEVEQKFYTNVTWMVLLMQKLPKIGERKMALLIPAGAGTEREQRESLLDFTAVLALRGPVCVLDAGNRFDPYHITRAIRRQTAQLDQALGRIYIARAFTCYQVITLLQKTPATPMPHLIFDLLATFSDQAVSSAESIRLLQIAVAELLRLRRHAPVIVSAGTVAQGNRSGLLRLLKATADLVLLPESQMAVTLERML